MKIPHPAKTLACSITTIGIRAAKNKSPKNPTRASFGGIDKIDIALF
jgi:hypothetical protein